MLLDHIENAADLRRLSVPELESLAGEIRELIIDTVSRNGGHLGASLGTVELILALHRIFDVPDDELVFDVGHQAYTHKILTGRRELFRSLRQFGGCSGFPLPSESPADASVAGHAGSAISTALGIAAAAERSGSAHKAVAIVGDGSLNCGISLEGLNNARACGNHLVVILNDNKMSISENVGGLSHYLNRLISGNFYNRTKTAAKRILQSLPRHETLHRLIRRSEDVVKNLILPGVIFEELGFRYMGPINGHDLPTLLRLLERAKEAERPVFLHVLTEKGRGYEPARRNPVAFHGVAGFDRATGALKKSSGPTFSKAFGAAAEQLAAANADVVAITAAMAPGTGLAGFSQHYPERFYDVGIAEEHAVAFAAGLARGGLRPICAIYATFMQRALDCIYHDVAIARLPVIFALDRAGVVEDGPTHHGIYDLGFLRAVPHLTIMAPRSERELAMMMEEAYRLASPVVIRYPRGGSGAAAEEEPPPLIHGRAELFQEGDGPVIWAMGPECFVAREAAALLEARRGVRCAIVNARYLKPFDAELARELATPGRLVVSLEDHVCAGGLAAALDEALAGTATPRLALGWPSDETVPHGAVRELRRACRLTPEAIADVISAKL